MLTPIVRGLIGAVVKVFLMRGRPTDYSPELCSVILSRVAQGESLRRICKDDDMPSASSIFLWLQTHKDFSDNYDKACVERADAIFEEALEIADDGSNDWMVREGKDTLNGEHIQRSRLRVDTRKWFLAKMLPKKYGDKQTVEHSDPAGNNPFAPLMDMIAANGRPRPGS